MHSTFTRSRASSSRRSCGSKRASCSSAAAPDSHGAMNTLRADFDQPLAAVHHTSSPARAPEPVLGLQALAVEVALAVQHRLRLARGAARERDQAGVLSAPARPRARARPRTAPRRARARPRTSGPRRLAARSRLRSSATISAGWRHVDAQAQVLRAQLLGARQHDRADAKARAHRRTPTRGGCRSASSRRRPRPTPRARERARQARAALGDLAEASTRAASRRARARPARAPDGGGGRRRRGRSSCRYSPWTSPKTDRPGALTAWP